MNYELLNEYVIPLMRIERIDNNNDIKITDWPISENSLNQKYNRINVQIEYCPNGLPFNNINEIDRNYYIKSIRSFVFLRPINCNGVFKRIFEVPSDLADELENAFDVRLRKASISYELRVLWDRFVRLFE